ncbi:MAG: hypothetical protein AAGG51_01805 [Cyanobacteria bacterium P01_G01_bin.54]
MTHHWGLQQIVPVLQGWGMPIEPILKIAGVMLAELELGEGSSEDDPAVNVKGDRPFSGWDVCNHCAPGGVGSQRLHSERLLNPNSGL